MLPNIKKGSGIGKTVQVAFGGFDRRPGAGDGTFWETAGMRLDRLPLLASREKRKRIYVGGNSPQTAIGMGDALISWFDGDLYYDDWYLCTTAALSVPRMVPFGRKLIVEDTRQIVNLSYPLKGRVLNEAALPANPAEGDAWLVGSGGAAPVFVCQNGEWEDLGPVIKSMEAAISSYPMVFRKGSYQGEAAEANTIEINPNMFSLDPDVPAFTDYFKVGDAVEINGTHPENDLTLIIREITETELRFYENSFRNWVGRHTVGVEGLSAGDLCEVRDWDRLDRGQYGTGEPRKYFILPMGVNLDQGDYVEYVFNDSQPNPLHYFYVQAKIKFYRADGTEVFITEVNPTPTYDHELFPNGPKLLSFEGADHDNMEFWDLSVSIAKKWPAALRGTFTDSNRMWGWDGRTLRASKLGDPENWQFFDGTAEDSWAVEVQTTEDFTGGISVHGFPTFYTAHRRYRVYGSEPESYQLSEQDCQGVRAGCAGAMAIVNGALYYVSEVGVMRDDGTLPACVSEAFGALRLSGAVGTGLDWTYWVAGLQSGGGYGLFALDVRSGTWIRDGGQRFVCLANAGSTVYGIERTTESSSTVFKLWKFNKSGSAEAAVSSDLQTNNYTMSQPNRKRVHRVQLRMLIGSASSLTVSIRYDDGASWVQVAQLSGDGKTRSVYLPVLPRRCDRFALRFQGSGDWELQSLALETRAGSAGF